MIRISIDFQLSFREKTDQNIVAEAILANLGSKEFFVNKAIGWSLRDYSKTITIWLSDFINEYKNHLMR